MGGLLKSRTRNHSQREWESRRLGVGVAGEAEIKTISGFRDQVLIRVASPVHRDGDRLGLGFDIVIVDRDRTDFIITANRRNEREAVWGTGGIIADLDSVKDFCWGEP